MPKLASARPIVSTLFCAHHSISAKMRSIEYLRMRELVDDPQSQNVQPYGHPRLVSRTTTGSL